jgi:uncharacterized RDD family membrane protein YckC
MALGCDAMVSALNIIGSDKTLQEHWVKRFVAIIIDSLLLYVIVGILFVFLIDDGIWTLKFQAIWSTSSGVVMFVYSFLLEANGGATLGKKVLDLRVISISDDEVDITKALIRNISKIHGVLFIFDFIVGFVTDGDPKQRMLDRVAGTTVVVTTSLGPDDQQLYQTQQAKYAPPPQEQYVTRHEQVYQYPPPSTSAQQQPDAPAQQSQPAAQQSVQGAVCQSCGGRMSETGSGRLQCIRCGKIR